MILTLTKPAASATAGSTPGAPVPDRHIVEAQKIDFRPLDPELVVTRNGVPFLGHSATIDIPEEYE